NATRSRRSTGAVWWLMPMASRVMGAGVVDRPVRGRALSFRRTVGRHFTARQPSMPETTRFPSRPTSRLRNPAILAGMLACLAIATPGTGAVAREAPVAGVLEATLAGEFALQSGKLDQATYWYLQAARAARGDAALAERAAGIALLAGEDDAARQAL